jgi:hypothetical protein
MTSPAATEYRGVCVLGEKPHHPVDIRCEDVDGNQFVLPIPEYESRYVQPPWRELPWCSDTPDAA